MSIPRRKLEMLKAQWAKVVAYESGATMGFLNLARSMDPRFSERLRACPNLSHLMRWASLESVVDFEKANVERDHLIDELSKSMTKDDLRELVESSLNFKIGGLSQAAYHAFLLGMMDKYQLDDGSYANLTRFGEYSSVSESLDLEAIGSELDKFGPATIGELELGNP